MGKLLNNMDATNKTLKKTSSTLKDITKTYDNIRYCNDMMNSKAYVKMRKKIKIYDKLSSWIMILFILLCIAIIISTIVLCITNNDIILNIIGLR
ncbi:MAG: hypothetical protein Q4E74_11470 [Ruminococcus sp.]|nr:hypothetical protein [Ruminococcus sp.]